MKIKEVRCENCKKFFMRFNSKIGKFNFCCRECKDTFFRKYRVKDNFFEEVDSDLKAYMIGFILTDGYIRNRMLSINLAGKDKEFLQKFASILCPNYEVKLYSIVYKEKDYKVARLNLTSAKMINDLVKVGVPARDKSHLAGKCKISQKYLAGFVRGVFDGDGTIRWDKEGNLRVAIFGTVNLLGFIIKILKQELELDCKIRLSGYRIPRIDLNGNCKCLKFLNWMYNNAELWLPRKKEIYENKSPRFIRNRILFQRLPFSQERNQKISFALKGRKFTEEHKQKLRISRWGGMSKRNLCGELVCGKKGVE